MDTPAGKYAMLKCRYACGVKSFNHALSGDEEFSWVEIISLRDRLLKMINELRQLEIDHPELKTCVCNECRCYM